MKKLILLPSLKIGCLLLMVLGIVQLFVNPVALIANIVTVSRIGNELPFAKARWLSNQIVDYEIDVEGFVPLSCIYDTHLSVRGGKLTAVAVRENILDKSSPVVSLEPEKWDPSYGCSYSRLVIPSMFDRVERDLSINVWDASLDVKFDVQYGYGIALQKLRRPRRCCKAIFISPLVAE